MSSSVRRVLENLLHSTQATLNSLSSSVPPAHLNYCENADKQPIPPLHLPLPDIRPPLRGLNIPEHLVAALSDTFQGSVVKLRQQCDAQYTMTIKSLLTLPSSDPVQAQRIIRRTTETYQNLFTNTYIPRIQSEVLRRASNWACSQDRITTHKQNKTPFNPACTPLLEKYFESNAYPSAQDKLALARKSKMSMRQIDVWFQNHRNRAKKDGKSLHRCNGAVHLVNLQELVVAIPVRDVEERQPLYEDLTDEESVVDATHPFSQTAPSHAFPTPFSSSCTMDPFPSDNGVFRFPPPSWRRTASVSSPKLPLPVEFDDLVAMFSLKLNLRDNAVKKAPRKSPLRPTLHRPWFSATVTIPCRAPLPSFIPLPYSTAHLIVNPPSQLPSPNRILPPSNANYLRFQKPPPLPKRLPSQFNPTRKSSLSPPVPNSSRPPLPSYGSAASQSRHSSLSSIASAELATPRLSPTLQPSEISIEQDLALLDELLGAGAPYLIDMPDIGLDFSTSLVTTHKLTRPPAQDLFSLLSSSPSFIQI